MAIYTTQLEAEKNKVKSRTKRVCKVNVHTKKVRGRYKNPIFPSSSFFFTTAGFIFSFVARYMLLSVHDLAKQLI